MGVSRVVPEVIVMLRGWSVLNPRFASSISSSFLLSAIMLLSAGCGEEPQEQAAPPIRTADASQETADAGVADSAGGDPETSDSERQSFDGMSFYVPASWEQQQLSQMQQGIISARFGIPEADEAITVTLSVSGGGRDSNVARWKGQFSGGPEAVEETIRTAGGDADLIRLSGRFSPGFGRPAQDDWAMLRLIIPFESRHYFVKLTGPVAAVSDAESEFIEFCKSAKPE